MKYILIIFSLFIFSCENNEPRYFQLDEVEYNKWKAEDLSSFTSCCNNVDNIEYINKHINEMMRLRKICISLFSNTDFYNKEVIITDGFYYYTKKYSFTIILEKNKAYHLAYNIKDSSYDFKKFNQEQVKDISLFIKRVDDMENCCPTLPLSHQVIDGYSRFVLNQNGKFDLIESKLTL